MNSDNKNILLLKDKFINVNKKISNRAIINRDKKDIKNNDLKFDEKKNLNKSINLNMNRHIKFKSMKLDELAGVKFNKRELNNLYLKTKKDFFKH